MIKYIVLPTKFCNFIVLRVDCDLVPAISPNYIDRFKLNRFRCDLPPNSIRIIPYAVDANKAFDTFDDASIYAKSLFQNEKDKHIKRITDQLEYNQKRLDKMLGHTPKVKILSMVK